MLKLVVAPPEPLTRRFIVAPDALRDRDPRLPIVCESLNLLAARQNRDGSWGKHSALDKLIATCHATMTLLAAGVSTSERVIEKARRWLCAPNTGQHNNSYWTLGPLAAMAEYHPEVVPAIQRETAKLCAAIDSGAQPHPDQYAQAFYLSIVKAVPSISSEQTIRRYIEAIRSNWNREKGWAQRADTTTGCYAILRRFDRAFADEIQADVVRLVDRWADRPELNYTRWRNPISTAYTVMNSVESGLIHAPEIRNRVDEAVAWLVASRDGRGVWVSDVPFGGTGDIKSPDYPTAVITRSLLAHLSVETPDVQAAVLAHGLAKARAKLRRQRLWLIGLGLTSLVLGGALVGPAFWGSLLTLNVALVFAGIGVFFRLLAWAFPDARERLVVWLKRRMM